MLVDLSVLSLLFVILLLMTAPFRYYDLPNHELNMKSIVDRDFVFVDDSETYSNLDIVRAIDLNSSNVVNLSYHICQKNISMITSLSGFFLHGPRFISN